MRNINATYKGLITGLLMILSSVILYYPLKLDPKGYNQFIVLAVYVCGLLWSLISFKIQSGDSTSFKLYFAEGFKTFIVVTLLMVIFTFIFYKFNPQILEKVLIENEQLAAAGADHTPMEIKANSAKLRDIFMPMTIALATIKYLLIGVLVTIVGAVMLSQKK